MENKKETWKEKKKKKPTLGLSFDSALRSWYDFGQVT